MSQITSTPWKNHFGTSALQDEKRHECEWQDESGFQDKQKIQCMVGGVELEKYAIGPQMSNQQSKQCIFDLIQNKSG